MAISCNPYMPKLTLTESHNLHRSNGAKSLYSSVCHNCTKSMSIVADGSHGLFVVAYDAASDVNSEMIVLNSFVSPFSILSEKSTE